MNDTIFEAAIPILRVTDIDASLATYAALGFAVAWQHRLSPEAPRLTCVRHDSVDLYLTEHPVAPFEGLVYVRMRGVDALVARAAAEGLEAIFGPEDRSWGVREAYFRDPDGNVLRFGEQIGD